MINKTVFTFLILCGLVFLPTTYANALTLSVSPTLFEMSAVQSQSWMSSIKVINSNPQELTVYAKVVNFAPLGESGQGQFEPLFEDFSDGKTLAEWITVSSDPIIIPRESSKDIPISVHVPDDASPGGHFAAIMIGTKPIDADKSFQVATAQVVTSLFFVRIEGDVVEKGSVRTFRTSNTFFDTPDVDFEVRFENKGNVHIQPQGEILITNMWGKERGVVPINRQTHFGNVLPESIRKFEFNWKGEQSFTDIGRYKAVLTLAFGKDERQFVNRSTYFWIVPVKEVLIVLSSFIFILWFMSWTIRTYVRRMLAVSGVKTYIPPSQRDQKNVKKKFALEGDVLISANLSVEEKTTEGASYLKSKYALVHSLRDMTHAGVVYVINHKKFFGSILVGIIIISVIWYFVVEVTTPQRDYEITIDNIDTDVTISSEEILYKRKQKEQGLEQVREVLSTEDLTGDRTSEQTFELLLINSSDTPGLAATMQTELEEEGYSITSLKSDFGKPKTRTVIVYDVEEQESALVLSKLLGGALLSARSSEPTTSPTNISVFIGNDYNL